MAKSTGNFMTLEDMVKKYGADASRIALADAGDGVADANFEEDVADNNILRLYTLKEWCEQQVEEQSALRADTKNDFLDLLFENEMNGIVAECREHYEATDYKLALKSALYDFIGARDFYREACIAAGIKMHRDLILKYIELQALLLAVIAPHWCEYIWLEVLKKPSTIQFALYPTCPPPNPALSATREFVRATSSNINSAEAAQVKKQAKGREASFDAKRPKKLTIFSAANFPEWQDKYIELVREHFDETTLKVDDKAMMGKVAKGPEMKKAMAFIQGIKRRLQNGEKPSLVFNRKLPFDELDTLKKMVPGLKKAAGLESVDIVSVQGEAQGLPPQAASAVPGIPTFSFENVEA